MDKISCLSVTQAGRLDLFKKSVQCYLDQTYENKELIIVTDAEKQYTQQINEIIKPYNDIKLIVVETKHSLSDLRNISTESSSGNVIVQWDDDDFNAPSRLKEQYVFLKNSGRKCCYMSDQLQYFTEDKTLYWNDWAEYWHSNIYRNSLIPGTVMLWKKYCPKYRLNLSKGEDTVFMNQFQDHEIARLRGLGYCYIYVTHNSNTWDKEHHKKIGKHRCKYKKDILAHKDKILSTLSYMKLSTDPISVLARDGLAFEY
jgi:glycosyltransferase involved in cell wall biosynthesis